MSLFVPERRSISRFEREKVKVTDEYVEKILGWITDRDLNLLELLVKHPFLTSTQIEYMVFASLKPSSRRTTVNRRLQRLYRSHCVDRWFPLVTEQSGSSEQHVLLDRAGILVLAKHWGVPKENIKYKKREYIPQSYKHTLKLFDFKATLSLLDRQLGVVKDKTGGEEGTIGELIMWKQENQCRLKFLYENKATILVPDAFVVYKYTANNRLKLFFLEADNATEPIDTLKMKIKKYIGVHKSGEWRNQPWAHNLPKNTFPSVVFLLHDQESVEELRDFSAGKNTKITFLFATYSNLVEQSYKAYYNKAGKRRLVLEDIHVRILEDIWQTNKKEGYAAL